MGSHGAGRVSLAPAYVLHQYPYRDTSRIVEVFTIEHGRLSLFARGAAGPKSALKGILRPFQRLLLSWAGKSDACALVAAEIDGPPTALGNERLMSGFYLNELLLKLTHRWDPHREVFLAYAGCVQALCAGDGEEAALRIFEKRLLQELGFGLQLSTTDQGLPVDPEGHYRMALERGPQSCVADTPGAVYGRSLRDLDAGAFADSRSLKEAKAVLRAAIDACLDGRVLKSREVMRSLRRRRTTVPHVDLSAREETP